MTTPTTGWRIWGVSRSGYLCAPFMRKPNYEMIQEGTISYARCTKKCPEIPGDRHQCGVFFIRDADVILQQSRRHTMKEDEFRFGAVITLIEPLGRVLPGRFRFGGVQEFRSTAVEIKAIVIGPELDNLRNKMQRHYGVPVLSVFSPMFRALRTARDSEAITSLASLEQSRTRPSAGRVLTSGRCEHLGCTTEPFPGSRLCRHHNPDSLWSAI
ncbi:hypothetical protein ACRAJ3_19605 [Rhodococcus pyridinivorans]|uniref:hypothetical protein n=1 Tax=Rhodococcus pyridinivorans TaxID=103816 RepID=UPI003D7FCE88